VWTVNIAVYVFAVPLQFVVIIIIIIVIIIICAVDVVWLSLGTDGDMQWYLSQVKGTIEEDVTEGK